MSNGPPPWYEPMPFLQTHRSASALTRELDLLSEEIEKRLESVTSVAIENKRDVRRSPGRCVVQLGAVSLTVSWVRSRDDTIANGRMMVVHWRGLAGGGGPWLQEEATMGNPRRTGPKPKVAAMLSQRDLIPYATSANDWTWQDEASAERLSSGELAAWCIDTLVANCQACSDKMK